MKELTKISFLIWNELSSSQQARARHLINWSITFPWIWIVKIPDCSLSSPLFITFVAVSFANGMSYQSRIKNHPHSILTGKQLMEVITKESLEVVMCIQVDFVHSLLLNNGIPSVSALGPYLCFPGMVAAWRVDSTGSKSEHIHI